MKVVPLRLPDGAHLHIAVAGSSSDVIRGTSAGWPDPAAGTQAEPPGRRTCATAQGTVPPDHSATLTASLAAKARSTAALASDAVRPSSAPRAT